MTFHEDWYADEAVEVLGSFAKSVSSLEGQVIEIGCWEGKSTVGIANAVFPDVVDAIDTWEGSPGEISEQIAKQRDVEAQFLTNIGARTQGNVRPHKHDWREWTFGPTKFCHIDGLHTYDEVRQTIAAVRPHMVAGGIICGDDVHHPPVCKAVLEAFPDAEHNGSIWIWKNRTLEEHYRKACETPSDINEHLPTFVDLVDALDATKVIELGTRGGVSTIAWLYALEGQGRLWSVDICLPPEGLSKYDHWTFVNGDDCDPDVVSALPPDADVVFIDTSHAYRHTLRELNIYRWRVRPGGYIVLHDTELERPFGIRRAPADPPFPVRAAVELFCMAEGLEWTNHKNNNGLAVVKIP